MKRKNLLLTAIILATTFAVTGCSGKDKDAAEGKLDPKNPVEITLWNYYSGEQLDGFNKLVEEFNQGKGKELGVQVTSLSQGSLGDLSNAVLDAAEKKVGSDEVPNLFMAYADFAYEMDQRDLVQDVSSYFTEEELSEYIDGYIKEGEFSGDGSLKIFPIAKSTEVLVLNETDWNIFAEETGASKDDLATMEGVVETARKYYEWTDSKTKTEGDGKAFFGRDAMANYMLIGAKQLGTEIISKDKDGKTVINFDEKVARKLWDNYYVPYVKGYFSAIGRFRSDDMKTGNVIAYVGSASSATFTPDQVTNENNTTYDIETGVYAAPQFEDGEKSAVQQGAGLVVTKGTEQQVAGSVEFLKWFTDQDQNIAFAMAAGYMPVKKEANDFELMEKAGIEQKEIVSKTMKVAVDTVNNNTMYTPSPVENGSAIRSELENVLSDKAVADRTQIESLIEAGSKSDEAIDQFVTDENFEAWYNETKAKLESAE